MAPCGTRTSRPSFYVRLLCSSDRCDGFGKGFGGFVPIFVTYTRRLMESADSVVDGLAVRLRWVLVSLGLDLVIKDLLIHFRGSSSESEEPRPTENDPPP